MSLNFSRNLRKKTEVAYLKFLNSNNLFSYSWKFDFIDIERSDECAADYLQMIDGPTLAHDDHHGKLCGSLSNIGIQTIGADAILKFHSNGKIQGTNELEKWF